MKPIINIITLGVSDLKRARAFYETLGWKISSAGNEHIAFFKTRGVVLALFSRDALAEDAHVDAHGSGFRGVTMAQNVTKRDQVSEALDEAERAGGRIVKRAQDAFWGGHSGYFADPDGHLWEVAWNPHFKYGPDGEILLP